MSRRQALRNLSAFVLSAGSSALVAACYPAGSGHTPPPPVAPTPLSSAEQASPFHPGSVRFAVIGDYGGCEEGGCINNWHAPEGQVARLVRSWAPDFITTVGDNNYPLGSASTIDQNIGQFYHDYIFPYKGTYGAGAASNRFWPIYGHRDWDNDGVDRSSPISGQPYRDYFSLPGNGRYYDFAVGPVHFFMLNTDRYREPDGTSASSLQAKWLQTKLAAAREPWKLIYAHHAPYTSAASVAGIGGSLWMRWPFAAWGATAVLQGYYHSYERILRDGIVYFVNGVGGGNYLSGLTYPAIEGSQSRYNRDHGAMLVNADRTRIQFQFFNRVGTLIDSYTLPP